MEIKLATYNISHCIDYGSAEGDIDSWTKVDLPKAANLIKDLSVDIIGMQEVYDGIAEDTSRQIEKLADGADYAYYKFAKGCVFPWKDIIGNGIMSKYPIKSFEAIPVLAPAIEERDPNETEWFEDRVILKATVDVGRDIDIITTHFGLNPSEKERMRKALTDLLDNRKNPVILMGDFNAEPHSEVLKPYYDRLKSAADIMGHTDDLTFSSYKPYLTLDYFFLSDEFKVTSYEVVKEVVSDHFPVTITVEI